MPAIDRQETLKWAEFYLNLGWHLTFFQPGTKGPSGPSSVGWNTPRELVTTIDRAQAKLAGGPMNMGLCHLPSGTISLDVDDESWTRVIFDEFGIDYDAVLGSGMRIKSKSGRDKAIFLAPSDLDLHKVSWPKPDAIKPTDRFTIFELRSGPNQDVLPPSLHPDGHQYEWHEGKAPWDFNKLPEIPDELLNLWRNFSAMKDQIEALCPWKKTTSAPRIKIREGVSTENQDIIGKYNAQADVFALLKMGGYKKKGKRWVAPSSSTGIPGVVVFEDGKVFSHHGSDILSDGFSHDAFDLFVLFEHAGNFNEALSHAARIVGIEKGATRFVPEVNIDLAAIVKNAVKDAVKEEKAVASKQVCPTDTENYTPVPDSLLNPGGVIGEVIDWMLETAQQPRRVLSLVGAISVVATIIGRKVMTETGLRTNMQLVSVAGTSVGKDHARKCNKKILMACGLDDFIGGEEIASGAALLARMGDQPNTLFQLDEFGLMMQSINNPKSGSHKAEIMSSMMKMFSSSGTVFHGAEYADRKNRERKDIDHPCLNIHATTTAEMLWPALNSSHSSSGFLNRLLFLFEPTVRIKRRHTSAGQPPESIVEWAKSVRGANIDMEGLTPGNPICVPMSERAIDEFDAFEDWINDRMDAAKFVGADALWGRAWEHASKIALIVTCGRFTAQQWVSNQRPEIGYDEARYGIDFVKFSIGEIEREVAARVSDSEFGHYVNEATKHIIGAGEHGLTERELARKCYSFKGLNPVQRDMVLATIKRNGDAIFANMGKCFSGRGKDREAWVATVFVSDEA